MGLTRRFSGDASVARLLRSGKKQLICGIGNSHFSQMNTAISKHNTWANMTGVGTRGFVWLFNNYGAHVASTQINVSANKDTDTIMATPEGGNGWSTHLGDIGITSVGRTILTAGTTGNPEESASRLFLTSFTKADYPSVAAALDAGNDFTQRLVSYGDDTDSLDTNFFRHHIARNVIQYGPEFNTHRASKGYSLHEKVWSGLTDDFNLAFGIGGSEIAHVIAYNATTLFTAPYIMECSVGSTYALLALPSWSIEGLVDVIHERVFTGIYGALQPDIFWIQIAPGGAGYQVFKTKCQTLIDRYRVGVPTGKILITSAHGDIAGIGGEVAESDYVPACYELAQENAGVLFLNTQQGMPEQSVIVANGWSNDGIHLNAAGLVAYLDVVGDLSLEAALSGTGPIIHNEVR